MTTIPEIVIAAANKFAASPAIEENGQVVSYQELAVLMDRAGAAFLSAGLNVGDRVAIWAPNSMAWIIAALGAQVSGGVIVPLNTRMKGAEAAYVLTKSKAKILVTVSGFLGADYPEYLEDQDIPSLKKTILLSGKSVIADCISWQGFLSDAAVSLAAIRERRESLDGDCFSDIIFTSGTTGAPKGVMATHDQSVVMFDIWCDHTGLRSDDRYLIVAPFFHTFGYKAGWLACLLRGATIIPHAIFDVKDILSRIKNERISVLPGPPTLYQSLLMDPATKEADISSLRMAATGAAMIPVQLIEQMKTKLGFETVVTAYGLTEACGVVTMCSPDDDPVTIATTSGRAVEGIEMRCVDLNGTGMPAGEAGEIIVKGYTVMKGYFEDKEATAETLTADGWLHTGDVGIIDDRGYLRITDRIKDMLIVGGFNCYPAEIENILLEYPAVGQVAIIGMDDERMGELPYAFVVPSSTASFDSEKLIQWCRGKMANYKVPRGVQIVDSLPLNASGKVQKFKLREMVKRQVV